MKKYTKGFTLIELLVVIAIIGILASVVLVSLSTARQKGADAKIIQQLGQARAAAEIYYGSNNNSYGTAGTSCSGGIFADAGSGMAATLAQVATKDCGNTTTAYSIAGALTATGGPQAWCIDSTGVSRGQTSAGVNYTGLLTATGAHTLAGAVVCN